MMGVADTYLDLCSTLQHHEIVSNKIQSTMPALSVIRSISKSDTWLMPTGDHFCQRVDRVRMRSDSKCLQNSPDFPVHEDFHHRLCFHNIAVFPASYPPYAYRNNKPKEGERTRDFPTRYVMDSCLCLPVSRKYLWPNHPMASVEEISMSLVREFLNRKVIRFVKECSARVRYFRLSVCIN